VGGDRLHVLADLVAGGGDDAGLGRRLLGVRAHLRADGGQLLRRPRQGVRVARDGRDVRAQILQQPGQPPTNMPDGVLARDRHLLRQVTFGGGIDRLQQFVHLGA